MTGADRREISRDKGRVGFQVSCIGTILDNECRPLRKGSGVAGKLLGTTMPNGRNSFLVKVAVGCAFLAVAITWQQYYFRAVDAVDANGTTLWNWPAFVLIAFGVVALIVRLFRFVRKQTTKSKQ
jgi:hypothetical protein